MHLFSFTFQRFRLSVGMNLKLKYQSTPQCLAFFFQHPERLPNYNITESQPGERFQPAKALAIMENYSTLCMQSY